MDKVLINTTAREMYRLNANHCGLDPDGFDDLEEYDQQQYLERAKAAVIKKMCESRTKPFPGGPKIITFSTPR